MSKEAEQEWPKVVFVVFGIQGAAEALAESSGSDWRSGVKFIDGADVMLTADAIIAEELRKCGS